MEHFRRAGIRQMMYFEGKGWYIFDFKRGDVTGDRVLDDVYLLGDKPFGEESPAVGNITLVILNGESKKYTKIHLKSDIGYNPTVFLGDFTGDGVEDILVSIDSGGSGAITFNYVYSYINNRFRMIFDYERLNNEYKYEVRYLDNYRAAALSLTLNKRYIIDLEYKGKEYLSEIYNTDGTLKAPLEGFVSPVSGFYPIDYERDGIYELVAFQRVSGRYAADGLGYVQTSIKWNGKAFVPFIQYVSIYGGDFN